MECLIIFVALVVVFVFLVLLLDGGAQTEAQRGAQSQPNGSAGTRVRTPSIRLYLRPPIPKGMRIEWPKVQAKGLFAHKEAVIRFAHGSDHQIKLRPEPANEHDRNAIQVIGIDQAGPHMIGYVPRDVAASIAEPGLTEEILGRIRHIWVGDYGGVDVKFDILVRRRGFPKLDQDSGLSPPATNERPRASQVAIGTLRVISLQSSSDGNCIYVEAGSVKLLFDAGISGIQVEERLRLYQRDVAFLDAVLISHDHIDHARHMGIYHRNFGLPIYVTANTYQAASKYALGEIKDINHFSAREKLRFGKVVVETIPTPHDGVDGVAFVVDDGRHRLGILTDLGHVFDELKPVMRSLDAVLLESNYDPDMLANGPYPDWLKNRIRGPGGHLSNHEAAHLLRVGVPKRMKWACLAHLSRKNNTPGLAFETHRRILGKGLPLFVASRKGPTGVLEL